MISVKDKLVMLFFNLNRLFIKPVLLLLCIFASVQMFAQNIPPQPDPPRLVNDFAGMMSPDEVNTLEHKLDQYDDSTSTQIAIVTIETLDGADVGSYAAELGKKWGVGTKKNHNGIVILLAKKERKVTIRTGYGVEEKLGSIICNNIIENRLVPNFKAGDYYKGFNEATDEIMQRLAGTYTGNGDGGGATDKGIPLWVIVLIVMFLLFVVVPIFFRGGGGNNTFGGGGVIGAGLGGFLGGGGFGGGGDSGGGFGGFGGGDFSGGGASGSW